MSWNLSTPIPQFEAQNPRPDSYEPNPEAVREVPITGKLRNFCGDYANVTLRGRVGTDPDITTTAQGHAAARFRLAVTRRGRDEAGVWHDVDTTWYTVKAWNGLAQNVGFSVRKGQPVMVQGRLSVNQWENAENNTRGTELVITASSIGHDLTAGVSQFMRPMRSNTELVSAAPNDQKLAPQGLGQSAVELAEAGESGSEFDDVQADADGGAVAFGAEGTAAASPAEPAF